MGTKKPYNTVKVQERLREVCVLCHGIQDL